VNIDISLSINLEEPMHHMTIRIGLTDGRIVDVQSTVFEMLPN